MPLKNEKYLKKKFNLNFSQCSRDVLLFPWKKYYFYRAGDKRIAFFCGLFEVVFFMHIFSSTSFSAETN